MTYENTLHSNVRSARIRVSSEFSGLTVVGDTVMTNATFFLQECPTCGRRLQVRVTYLGRDLECPHCSGRFMARDPNIPLRSLDDDKSILEKADELLAAAVRGKAAI